MNVELQRFQRSAVIAAVLLSVLILGTLDLSHAGSPDLAKAVFYVA